MLLIETIGSLEKSAQDRLLFRLEEPLKLYRGAARYRRAQRCGENDDAAHPLGANGSGSGNGPVIRQACGHRAVG
ncbi:hypothetical protein LJK88_31790 [Paenibacillus sp. P26]|nr:hypothetical protein LJK88_31790 [Paenibacillus sp. P26]